MRFVLARIEECTSASDVVMSLTILHAIRWIAQAWSQVRSEVMFAKSRYPESKLSIVSREVLTEDPFLDLDDQDQVVTDEEAQDLIERLQLDTPCSADELVSVDEDLAFCADLSDNQ